MLTGITSSIHFLLLKKTFRLVLIFNLRNKNGKYDDDDDDDDDDNDDDDDDPDNNMIKII